MIAEVEKLLQDWRVMGITAHDAFNWAEGKIELVQTDWRKLHVLPDKRINRERESRETTFFKQLQAATAYTKVRVTDADISDRFIHNGKLCLVIKGKVYDESKLPFRIGIVTCSTCKGHAANVRREILFIRLGSLCPGCYEGITLDRLGIEKSIGLDGYRAQYDPVLGSIKPTFYLSDGVDRSRFEAGSSGQVRESVTA